MRVCVDCTPLLGPSAGVKTYLFHLTTQLRMSSGGDRSVASFPWMEQLGDLRHDRSTRDGLSTRLRTSALNWARAGHLEFPPHRGIDLFHASNLVRSAPRKYRFTTTVHDLTTRTHPQLHTQATLDYDSHFFDAVVERAGGIICVSQATQRDLIRELNVHPDRTEVIYNGVADGFFSATLQDCERVRRVYDLRRPYLLFVGTIEPRKNVEALLDGYLSLRKSVQACFDLVIAGAHGWHSDETLRRLNASPPGVRYLGYVPERDLPALTADATIFVYPSLYEGFGLPVAQAMAAGVPVITSNAGGLPEVTGESALLVDPRSLAELTSAIDRLLTSPALQRRLAAKGQERARNFTWSSAALQTWKFFERFQ